eukprot:5735257-Karenia_brevis.AAC.1
MVDPSFGDLTDPTTVNFWFNCVLQKRVVGIVSGPPCETWSAAREFVLEDSGIRPVRDIVSLWGEKNLTPKERGQ